MNTSCRVFILIFIITNTFLLKSDFSAILLDIARSSNGRTAPSGGVYLGSSPSLAAKNLVEILRRTWTRTEEGVGERCGLPAQEGSEALENRRFPRRSGATREIPSLAASTFQIFFFIVEFGYEWKENL